MGDETAVVEVDRDEIVREIDRAAQERRGMTGRELLMSFSEGKLEDPGDVADILVNADLLPDNDPIRAGE